MNFLDILLIVLVLAYAVSGYWQGFVTGAFASTPSILRQRSMVSISARVNSISITSR